MAAMQIDEQKLTEQLSGVKPISKEMVDGYDKLIAAEETALKDVWSVGTMGNPLIENHIKTMKEMYNRLHEGMKMFQNPGLINDVNK